MTKAQKFRKHFNRPERFDAQNLAAAKLILDRAKPGETGISIDWAKAIVERHVNEGDAKKLEAKHES